MVYLLWKGIKNLDLFGLELSPEELEQIAALDRGEKHDWY